MTTRALHPIATRRPAERGSAYLFVLLGLLVLTIIGLSLVVITQTEAQIGGAEKSRTRVFFGADSGLNAQLGLHFLQTAPISGQFTLDTDNDVAGTGLMEVVDVSDFVNLYSGPCALCSVNIGGDTFYVNNFVVNSRGKRLRNGVWADVCEEPAQAVKRVTGMYLIQPEKVRGGGLGPFGTSDNSARTIDPDRITEQDDLVDGTAGISGCEQGLDDIVF